MFSVYFGDSYLHSSVMAPPSALLRRKILFNILLEQVDFILFYFFLDKNAVDVRLIWLNVSLRFRYLYFY